MLTFREIAHTLVYLIKINWRFTLIFSLLIAWIGYRLKDPVKGLIRQIKALKSNPECFKEHWQGQLSSLGEKAKANARNWWKILPTALALILSIALFRLAFLLPFVKRERKRFEREKKPLLAFKSFHSFIWMGLAGSFGAMLLTNYVVTLLRYLINFVFRQVSQTTIHNLGNTGISFPWIAFDWKNLWHFNIYGISPILSFPVLLAGLIWAWRSAWINFEQFRDYNNNEEGDDRFATKKEITQQYQKVPDKNKTYQGEGGFPVMHTTRNNLAGAVLKSRMMWENETFNRFLTRCEKVLALHNQTPGDYYLSTESINVLSVGMSRSRKGENWILTSQEINTRASKPPSLIIGDPKGENYQQSYKTLRKRNYDVEVLNYLNMDQSMGNNPLWLATDYAKKGYYEEVQAQINKVAENHYRHTKPGNATQGNAKFFEDSSISLFNAIALALIDRAKETEESGEADAWDTITMRNVATFLSDLGSSTVLVDEQLEIVEGMSAEERQFIEKRTAATLYFNNLAKVQKQKFSRFREMAINNYNQSNFAGEEAKGNIYSSFMTGLNLYLQDNIAKLTSKNSIDLRSIGNPRRLSVRFRSSTNEALQNAFVQQTAYVSITGQVIEKGRSVEKVFVNRETALIDSVGYLNYIINPFLPDTFEVTITFDHPNNSSKMILDKVFRFTGTKTYKTKGLKKVLDKYTNQPILDKIAISNISGDLLEEKDIDLVYSEKPKAVFLVLPPNKTEYNSLASIFLDQVFNVNYELALKNGRQCSNKIINIFDEFTNLPKIADMDSKISICLGQGIMYWLWIQNPEQLDQVYGQVVAQTIVDNCSLNVYIKAGPKSRANKEYSEALGSRTIVKRKRSSNILDDANPNVDVSNPKQPLLSPTELTKLQPGEAVILRGVKPFDRSGQRVVTDPIFLTGKTAMPARYMFLNQEYDAKATLSDIPVECPHRHLDLQDIAIPAQESLDNLIDWRQALERSQLTNNQTEPKLIGRKRATIKQVHVTQEGQVNNVLDQIFNDPEDEVDDYLADYV